MCALLGSSRTRKEVGSEGAGVNEVRLADLSPYRPSAPRRTRR